MSCIFCQIANKEISTKIIYEDELVIAFDDLSPQAPIHKLIIPRQHISTLNDLSEDNKNIAGHMMFVAKTLAEKFDISDSGYRILVNCNNDGGQTVFHLHLHLLGGRKMHWPPG